MFDRITWITAAVLITSGVLAFLWPTGIYDTYHMHDTLFLAELGWRAHLGAVPVLDFNHFYGGVTAQYIGLAFGLFGTGIKALDYVVLLQIIPIAAFAMVVSYRRIGGIAFWFLLLLTAGVMLTRAPLEVTNIVNFRDGVVVHSYPYNRHAIALALVVIVFAIVRVDSRAVELAGALASGGASFTIMMLKPTFVIFIPAVILVLLLQRRRQSLAIYVSGLAVLISILDPGAAKLISSFRYAMDASGVGVSVGALIFKAFLLVWTQALAAIPALYVLFLVLRSDDPAMRRITMYAVILMAGSLGMAATMGWVHASGQQAVPFFAILMVLFFEHFQCSPLASVKTQKILKAVTIFSVFSFSAPIIVYSVATSFVAASKQPFALITTGPLQSYVAWGRSFHTEDGLPLESPLSLDQQTALAFTHLQTVAETSIGAEYVMLADGIRALGQIEDVSELGIVSDSRIAFSYAMEAPPVLDFPVWATKNSPELADGIPLSNDIDLLLELRPVHSQLAKIIAEKRGDDFSLCIRTVLWNIYARDKSGVIGCTAHEEEQL